METDSDSNKNKSEKRKLSESETESDDCKKAHLDSDVTSTIPSTEDGSLLPKNSSPIPLENLTPIESFSSSNIEINKENSEKETSVSAIHISEHGTDTKDKEGSVVIQSSEHVTQHDVDMKDKEGSIDTKYPSDILQSNNSENKEMSPLCSDNSSAYFAKQSKDIPDALINYEKTSKLFSNHSLDIGKEKLPKDSILSEVEKSVKCNTDNTFSVNIKDNENKLYSASADFGTSEIKHNFLEADFGTCENKLIPATANLETENNLNFSTANLKASENKLISAPANLETNKNKLISASANLETNENKLPSATANLETSENKLIFATANLDTSENKLISAAADLETSENKLISAETNLKTSENKLISATANLETNENRLISATVNLETSENKLIHATTDFDSSENNPISATTNLETSENKLISAITNLETSENKFVSATANLETSENKLISETTNLETNENKLISATTNLETGENKFISATTNLETSENKLISATTNLETSENKLISAAANLETSENKLISATTNLETSENKLISTKTNLETSENKLISAVANLKTSENQLNLAGADLETIEEKLISAAANLETSENQLNLAGTDLETIEDKLISATANLKTSENKLNFPEAGLEIIEDKLISATSNLESSENKLNFTAADLETSESKLISATTNLETSLSQEANFAVDKKDEKLEDVDRDKEEKELSPEEEETDSNITYLVSNEIKESPSFEGTLKNISPISNIVAKSDVNDKKCIISTVIKPPLNIETTFVPIPQSETSTDLCNELEAELDKKSEVSAMEVESNNLTPNEGSLVETPCDSGDTSPSMSTPADSCQVSAAPSPLLKEDPAVSESLIDDSSMDTKDIPDENEEDKELESIRPVRFGRRKKKTIAQKYKKGKRKSTPMLVDEETRMSATGTPELGIDEDSQSSVGTTTKKETIRRYKSEVIVPESTEVFTAEKVFEYVWPLEGLSGEHYFIQEHMSQYLGVSSFKRRYPDLRRRPIESQEKEYLKDLGLVTEIACDLGLTAVRSEDMLDIMYTDFQMKYEELQRVLREKKERQLKEKGKVEYQVVNLDKSKMKEYSRKAALNASKWNAAFNRERHEERRYSFDLQTFSLHLPTSRGVKLPPLATKLGSYPIAVLPGQYTDYCKMYSTNELKGMPLQSVLSGPFTAEELAAELQDDSDDDISAVASVGTCPEFKEEPETATPITIDPLSAEKQPRCKVCNGGRSRNKDGKPEPLIICGTCRTPSHPTCIDLTLAMTTKIESYSWQCMDCKTCAQCNDPDDEERMIFCDMCDRGYHIYCVGLRRVPNGRWHCKECAVCFTCGSRNPSGSEHIKNAEWQHEFKKDKDNKQLKYVCTLCVPCDKYWKRRQFCSVCMKVYRSIPEDGMVRCLGCPKYVHKDECSILQDNERFCNYCFKNRNSTALTHSRIIAAAKKKMATGSPVWK